jgi:hypothetical protein
MNTFVSAAKVSLIVSILCVTWALPARLLSGTDREVPGHELGYAATVDLTPGSANHAQASEAARRLMITGAVLDQSGQALANAAVYLSGLGSRIGGNRTEWTDDDGKFQFSNLSSGVFTVFVRVPTHYTDSPDGQPIYVRAGDSIKIRMIKGGIVTGKVTGPSGEPLIAAPVKPTRIRDQEGSLTKGGGPSREFLTDDRGIYRIYGLPPGSYVVSVGGGRNYGQQKPYDLNAPTYFPPRHETLPRR